MVDDESDNLATTEAAAPAPVAPPITDYLDADLKAKYLNPAYSGTFATQSLIAAVEQVLRNQQNELAFLKQQFQDVASQLALLVAAIPPKPGPAASGKMHFSFVEELPMPNQGKMKFAFPDNLTAVATLALVDAAGVAGASPDAPPTWKAGAAFLTVTPAADGMSCTFKIDPTQSPVAGDVPVEADCVGGGTAFSVIDKLTVQAGPAAGGSMSFVTQ